MTSWKRPDTVMPDSDAQWAWNVVERSQRGHERKRRLGWRMTDREASEWSAANGVQVERVQGSATAEMARVITLRD